MSIGISSVGDLFSAALIQLQISIGINGICDLVVSDILQSVQLTTIVGLKECIGNNENACQNAFKMLVSYGKIHARAGPLSPLRRNLSRDRNCIYCKKVHSA